MSTRSRRVALPALLLTCAFGLACGQKGPPLPPLRRVPAPVGELTARRVADRVIVQFTVPSTNVEGPGAANLDVVDVFGITSERELSAADAQQLIDSGAASRVAQLPVAPPLPPVEPGARTPPPSTPAGLAVQGATVTVVDTLDSTDREISVPQVRPTVPFARDSQVSDTPGASCDSDAATVQVQGMPALRRRYYAAVGRTPNGRPGALATPVAISLERPSSAPESPRVNYDERSMRLQWQPAADARLVEPPIADAGLLPSRPLVAPPPPTRYDVYDASGVDLDSEQFARAAALNPEPLAALEFRIDGVTFGKERCFVVRPVDRLQAGEVRGEASGPACVTPVDTFAPAAPRDLAAVPSTGSISLIWEPGTEADLGGYVVLRGLAPGDTLAALTPTPIRETTFRDTEVEAGVRYVYAVVAVDTATPQNVSAQSNRVEEASR